MRVLVVFGTRPEAIKMCPLVRALRAESQLSVKVCVTAQHRQMLDQVLELFEVAPHYDLNLMREGQNLSDITSGVLLGLAQVLRDCTPELVLVHGDTTTSFAATLASFYARVPVGHVEAGLRTGDLQAPWPEEANRRLTGVLSSMHFAPTPSAADNLRRERVPDSNILVTGNTVIDGLLFAQRRLLDDAEALDRMSALFPDLVSDRHLLLVTGHRRESFGGGLERICSAIRVLAERNPELMVVYPVHLNPRVQEPVRRILSGIPNVFLIPPQDYLPFVYLMRRSHVILTDSGGIQEEAPALGKPVLVMRDNTERPEAVEAGTVRLVGTHTDSIVTGVQELLDNPAAHGAMAHAHNPYGDGRACERIADFLVGRAPVPFLG